MPVLIHLIPLTSMLSIQSAAEVFTGLKRNQTPGPLFSRLSLSITDSPTARWTPSSSLLFGRTRSVLLVDEAELVIEAHDDACTVSHFISNAVLLQCKLAKSNAHKVGRKLVLISTEFEGRFEDVQ
jgi:hypothetical protein